MKSSTTMTPDKRERYAQWLRNTGVEHPSDELIDKTRERALLQIDDAKDKARDYKVKLVAVILGSLVVAVCVWLKL
ncbi:MAG: hypothetical protein ABSF72_00980 [Candidatus Sulfotelmatobacter sp.]